jgi:2-keto-4-pentenoate hydratase/2-oxohepta-3-ene-1,7-dioic acid hydratase in catechol pathway
MRLATVRHEGGSSAALVVDERVAPVRTLPGRQDAADVTALIARPLEAAEVDALHAALRGLEDGELLPPVPHPPKNVLCVGRNYAEHVREGARFDGREAKLPGAPVWFTKPHTTLIGHGAAIPLDPGITAALDYEGELALVIGRGGRDIAAADALAHVFGYTILNDVTARDLQRARGQFFAGKSRDRYGPCGPWLVTADELGDPGDLRLTTRVDGEVRQDDTTASMLFDVPTLIADISRGLTLEPGDVISTGTPSGVGMGFDPPRYLAVGSEVEVEVAGIGRLANHVIGS